MSTKNTRLLLSNSIKEITQEPFCFFQTDSYLPFSLYQKLKESFPDKSFFVNTHKRGKTTFQSDNNPDNFNKFCQENPLWNDFLQCFMSNEFLDDAFEFLKKPLNKARGKDGKKRWILANSNSLDSSNSDVIPIEVRFEFSMLSEEAMIVPHTDAERKIFSLLFYFPDEDWKPEYGGGLNFFRPKNIIDQWNFENRVVPFNNLEEIASAPFTANRLLGFVKSRNSWHGVKPLKSLPGIYRKSLNINFLDSSYKIKSTFLKRVRSRLRSEFIKQQVY